VNSIILDLIEERHLNLDTAAMIVGNDALPLPMLLEKRYRISNLVTSKLRGALPAEGIYRDRGR
jgi:hypothetical protein